MVDDGVVIPAGTWQTSGVNAFSNDVAGSGSTPIVQMPPVSSTADLIRTTGTVAIEDVTLDGNLANRGAYLGYEQEQSALLWVSSGTATIDAVALRNSPGDGIVIGNATAVISNVTAVDCYRGALTINQAGANVTVTNFVQTGTTPNDLGLNVELVDPFEDLTLDISDSSFVRVEVEVTPGGSTTLTNVTVSAGFFAGGQTLPTGPMVFTDCEIGMVDSGFLNQLRHYHDVSFVRCNFSGARLLLTPETDLIVPSTALSLTFEDCTFTGPGTGPAIYNNGSAANRGDMITFVGTNTYTGFASGYELRAGRYGATTGSLTPA